MKDDKITIAQKSKTIKDFNQWAKENNKEYLLNNANVNIVNKGDYRIPNPLLRKLKNSGFALQDCINKLIDVHNVHVNNISSNEFYMWEIHYDEEISKFKQLAKDTIYRVTQEVMKKGKRNGNPWWIYFTEVGRIVDCLVEYERLNEGAVKLLSTFNHDLIVSLFVEFEIFSPLRDQYPEVQIMFQQIEQRYNIQAEIDFNIPMRKFLQSKVSTIKTEEQRLDIIDDIMEMRSVLFKHWDAEKHRIQLDDKYDCLIDINCAIPSVAIVSHSLAYTNRRTFDTISWDLFTGKAFYNSTFFYSYGLSADYLLEQLHEYLYQIYVKCTFKQEQPDLNNQYQYDPEQYLIYNQLKQQVEPLLENVTDILIVKLNSPRIPKVRQSRLFKWFENYLGCEVLSGKGSELKIFNPTQDGKIHIIGKHKKDPEVSSWRISLILKSIGIKPELWHSKIKYL